MQMISGYWELRGDRWTREEGTWTFAVMNEAYLGFRADPINPPEFSIWVRGGETIVIRMHNYHHSCMSEHLVSSCLIPFTWLIGRKSARLSSSNRTCLDVSALWSSENGGRTSTDRSQPQAVLANHLFVKPEQLLPHPWDITHALKEI